MTTHPKKIKIQRKKKNEKSFWTLVREENPELYDTWLHGTVNERREQLLGRKQHYYQSLARPLEAHIDAVEDLMQALVPIYDWCNIMLMNFSVEPGTDPKNVVLGPVRNNETMTVHGMTLHDAEMIVAAFEILKSKKLNRGELDLPNGEQHGEVSEKAS